MATNTYPTTPPNSRRFLTGQIVSISTADQVYIIPGFAGRIVKIWSVIETAITSNDADLTCKIGGTAVTGGLITVANSGSAAGTVDSATPTALNTFTAGQAIEIETDGASSTTSLVTITLELDPT